MLYNREYIIIPKSYGKIAKLSFQDSRSKLF